MTKANEKLFKKMLKMAEELDANFQERRDRLLDWYDDMLPQEQAHYVAALFGRNSLEGLPSHAIEKIVELSQFALSMILVDRLVRHTQDVEEQIKKRKGVHDV